MVDPYKTLGVSKTATQDEIKNAYRSLAKKSHPDLNPGKKDLEAKFKELNAAYEHIGSPEARAKFDRDETQQQEQEKKQEQAKSYYRTQQEGGRYSQSFGQNMGEDFFENLFRSSGKDRLYKMDVEFKDAALGAEREITLPGGKKLLVKIPAGITSGTKLKFKGLGAVGHAGGPNGDAFVEISVKTLPGFLRVGNNIETELPISFQEGLLGAEIKVPTLEGSVIMKIMPGVSTGTRLRIRGKGVVSGSERGDQIVVLRVVLPAQVSAELQEAVRNLGSQFTYNPRSES